VRARAVPPRGPILAVEDLRYDPGMSDRPNILVLLSDEHCGADLGRAAPDGAAVTPALDALASASTAFATASCQAPLCTPSRMCLLTGRRARRCGAYRNASILDRAIPTLADTFRAAGYETAYVQFRDAPDLLFDRETDPQEQRNLLARPEETPQARLNELRETAEAEGEWEALAAERDAHEAEMVRRFPKRIQARGPNQHVLADGRVIDADAGLYEQAGVLGRVEELFDDASLG
jgi:hypothetical protein